MYGSSAMFIRYDSESANTPAGASQADAAREFLFFGDAESDYRPKDEDNVSADHQVHAKECNEAIWTEAAESWDAGRLGAVFVSGSPQSGLVHAVQTAQAVQAVHTVQPSWPVWSYQCAIVRAYER